ncbi:MAG TPA: TetR/AcrR family transcriptional regulator [Acidimicrobiia bacterium]|nr:TetR/AcrR family transcriptional regulator [Acidimicrobiia bacterium]
MTVLEVRETTSVEARATAALLACVARFGLAKTTIDDLARESGCSRATLYRYFDSKASIVRQTVAAEIRRMTSSAVDAASAELSLGDAVVAATLQAARDLDGHAALSFLLSYEPESIVSHLTFAEGDRVLVWVGDALAPAFTRWLTEPEAQRAGEWIARVLRSYVLMPEPSIDLTDARAAREFLSELVVPGLGVHDG